MRHRDDFDLGGAEVTRCEDEVAASHHAQHGLEGRDRRPPSTTATDSSPSPRAANSFLISPPERLLARRQVPHRLGLVLGVDGREPDDARALSRRDLDCDSVEPADAAVQGDAAEHVEPETAARTTAARSAVGT